MKVQLRRVPWEGVDTEVGKNLGYIDKASLAASCDHAYYVVGVLQRVLGEAASIISSFVEHLIHLVLKGLHHGASRLCLELVLLRLSN